MALFLGSRGHLLSGGSVRHHQNIVVPIIEDTKKTLMTYIYWIKTSLLPQDVLTKPWVQESNPEWRR